MEALQKLVKNLDEELEPIPGGRQRRFPDRDIMKPHNRQPKLPKKGSTDRRIIKVFIKDGREHYLHATKGWRSRRA